MPAPLPEEGAAFLPPQPPPSMTRLAPLQPGAIPIQANDLRAPPVLIHPTLSLTESYTDNPRNTPNTFSDSITRLDGGAAISVDTVRLQGQLNGSLDYQKYARVTDLDTLNANLAAFGLGTIVPEHLYLDGRAALTQLSQVGGVGFANSTVIPPSEQTQAIIVSLTPIARGSLNGYVDGEFRYNYALNLFQNGSLLGNSFNGSTTPLVPSSSLPNATTNDATLSLATGRRFTTFGSKLTVEGTQISSQSVAKSDQLRAYDDLEYAITPHFAVLGRAGYEDLQYPLQPAATTTGPTWLIGGRVDAAPGDFLVVRYGRVDGFYGVNGALRYQITAATVLTASLQQNLNSTQEQLTSNLNSSELDQNGVIVNQYTGLQSALSNPEFAYSTTGVYRSQEARLGIQTTIGRNTFGVFAVYDRRKELGQPIGVSGLAATLAGSDISRGANINWSRSLTPKLTSTATLGYAAHIIGNTKTINADLQLSYTASEVLTAAVHYQFVNESSNISLGSFNRNQFEVSISRSF